MDALDWTWLYVNLSLILFSFRSLHDGDGVLGLAVTSHLIGTLRILLGGLNNISNAQL